MNTEKLALLNAYKDTLTDFANDLVAQPLDEGSWYDINLEGNEFDVNLWELDDGTVKATAYCVDMVEGAIDGTTDTTTYISLF